MSAQNTSSDFDNKQKNPPLSRIFSSELISDIPQTPSHAQEFVFDNGFVWGTDEQPSDKMIENNESDDDGGEEYDQNYHEEHKYDHLRISNQRQPEVNDNNQLPKHLLRISRRSEEKKYSNGSESFHDSDVESNLQPRNIKKQENSYELDDHNHLEQIESLEDNLSNVKSTNRISRRSQQKNLQNDGSQFRQTLSDQGVDRTHVEFDENNFKNDDKRISRSRNAARYPTDENGQYQVDYFESPDTENRQSINRRSASSSRDQNPNRINRASQQRKSNSEARNDRSVNGYGHQDSSSSDFLVHEGAFLKTESEPLNRSQTRRNSNPGRPTSVNQRNDASYGTAQSNLFRASISQQQDNSIFITPFAYASSLKQYLQNPLNVKKLSDKQLARLVVDHINIARLHSSEYSEQINLRLNRVKKLSWLGDYILISKDPTIPSTKLQEGKKAIKQCVSAIKRDLSINSVIPTPALVRAAEDRMIEIFSHGWRSENRLQERISKYGNWSGLIAESVWQGHTFDPVEIVSDLLIGDGDKKRSNREQLLHPALQRIGVAFGRHNDYANICVIFFASEVIPHRGVEFTGDDFVDLSNINDERSSVVDRSVADLDDYSFLNDDDESVLFNDEEFLDGRNTPFVAANERQSINRSYTNMDEFEIVLHDRKLGMLLANDQKRVYVQNLLPNGAPRAGGVRLGDQLIGVNGVSTIDKKYKEVLQLIKHSKRPIKLRFRHSDDNQPK